MAARVAGGLVGLVFGFTICWSGMTSPDVIRQALLFQDGYLFLFMASAMLTATVGLQLVRRREPRALVTGEPVRWTTDSVQRRHIAGAAMFGLGWGIADVCPGPVLTQLGQGVGWSLLTAAGVVGGVWLYGRRGRVETEPAREPAPAAPAVRRPAAATPATA